jgi:hypothetical protein
MIGTEVMGAYRTARQPAGTLLVSLRASTAFDGVPVPAMPGGKAGQEK